MSVVSVEKKSSRLPMLTFIAWRNLWRNKIRTLLTVFALAGGLAMMIAYNAVMEGMVRQMMQFTTEITLGHIQLHRQSFVDDQDIYATISWQGLDELEEKFTDLRFSPRLYAAGLGSASDNSTGIMIKGVDPQREKEVTIALDRLREGSAELSLYGTSKETGTDIYNTVIGAQLAKNLNVAVGDELIIITQAVDGSIGNGLFRISGVLKPFEPNFDRMGVMLSVEAFQNLMYLETGFHELAIATGNIEQIELRKKQIAKHISSWQFDQLGGAYVVRDWKELAPALFEMVEMSKGVVYILGAILIGLASFGMFNTMMMSIHERTHEFGILISIGIGRYWLLLMVLIESFFLALVSALLGGGLGVAGGKYMEIYGIDYSRWMPEGFDWAGMTFDPVWKGYLTVDNVVLSALLMIIISLIASFIPSWHLSRVKPVEMLS